MPTVTIALLAAFLSESIAFAFLVWGMHRRGRSLIGIGFPGFAARPKGYLAAIVVGCVYCVATIWANPSVAPWIYRPSFLKLLAIVTACMAAVFEETFFRGYLMTAMKDAERGTAAQLLASGVLFGMLHGLWGLANPHSVVAFIMPILWTTTLGFGFAAAYLIGGRKLAPVILAHALVDIILEPGLLISLMTARN
jgi:membrane protease YdiL (CAAX protease family)